MAQNPQDIDQLTLASNFMQLHNQVLLSDSWNKLYRVEFIRRHRIRFSLPVGLNGSDLLFNHLLFMHSPRVFKSNFVLYTHQLLDGSAVHRRDRKLHQSAAIILRRLIKEAQNLGAAGLFSEFIYYSYASLLRESLEEVYGESEFQNQRTEALQQIRSIVASHSRLLVKQRVNPMSARHLRTALLLLFTKRACVISIVIGLQLERLGSRFKQAMRNVSRSRL